MPDASTVILFAAAAAALIVMPGPTVIYVVARTVEQGRSAGIVSSFGVAAGELVHVIAAAAGISALLASSALAFELVKYVGAGYLVYLGVRRLLAREDPLAAEGGGEPATLQRIFGQGVVVSVLNPKIAIFFLAFLPQFVDPAAGPAGTQILVLGVVYLVIALICDNLWALLAGGLAGWLRRTARLHLERWASGGTLIALGLATAVSGADRK